MALITMLALDEIEIAAPVIAASPLLQDADLIRILLETTLEHQIAVARRRTNHFDTNAYINVWPVADCITERPTAYTA